MAKAAHHKEKADPQFIVVAPFRDKDNFSIEYNVGDDVSHFDKERLDNCIEKGLVKANDK